MATGTTTLPPLTVRAKLDRTPGRFGIGFFALALVIGCGYAVMNLVNDLSRVHTASSYPFVLLGFALAIALGFEFVNGFHDTANAVATVIYTHSLEPHVAVVWSGIWNFIGVLTSSGAVAFGIISLLPVELILRVGSGAGFAMIFALLTAAIIWNLGTWWYGLPASSSHTLVGSIIGVGIANQLMSPNSATSGVDWNQAINVGKTLLISPLVGFICAGLLFLLSKMFVHDPALYTSPEGTEPPPFWIRCLLVLTCTGVSFGHGSNDGQKGMGLIMLILVGTVPTAYALNHAISQATTPDFVAVSEHAVHVIERYVPPSAEVASPQAELKAYVSSHDFNRRVLPALEQLIEQTTGSLNHYGALRNIPAGETTNYRNNMYLVSETLNILKRSKTQVIAKQDWIVLDNYRKHIDDATKFIPVWVKVIVALALGLGTMVGWKRIVVTVGERIGKQHLTYAQGASAEITAAITILAADRLGLPVSTTHVLSSGVAGTMAANHAGLQWSTVRSLAAAWILTLPASIALSGSLFWLFRHF